jgi:excinuclease ABC subunit A
MGARGAVAFQSATPCPACDGNRLKPEALAVKVAGCTFRQVTEFSIRKAANDWFDELPEKLTDKQNRDRGAS